MEKTPQASRNHLKITLLTQPVERPVLPAVPHSHSHLKVNT
jgi:hypothetical protein